MVPPVTEVATDFRFDDSQMLLAIWCLGAGAAFLPWTIGLIRTRWLASRSAEFRGGGWPTLVQQGRDQLGMGREVRVLQTPHESTAHLAPHQTHRSISDEFDLRFMKPTMVACRGSPSPYGRKMNP